MKNVDGSKKIAVVLKVRTGLKAGGLWGNHNARGLKVRSGVKACGLWGNHNARALAC
jgi:hypothetical protein